MKRRKHKCKVPPAIHISCPYKAVMVKARLEAKGVKVTEIKPS